MNPHDKCPHLQISSESEGKCYCLECGMSQIPKRWRYIRSITHYKQLWSEGKTMPPVHYLVGETLQKQVRKFLQRKNKSASAPSHVNLESVRIVSSMYDVSRRGKSLAFYDASHRGKEQSSFYNEYIQFLRNNQSIVLPKKVRKRELVNVYGEHRRLILEYIGRLLSTVEDGTRSGSSPE